MARKTAQWDQPARAVRTPNRRETQNGGRLGGQRDVPYSGGGPPLGPRGRGARIAQGGAQGSSAGEKAGLAH